MKFLIQSTTLNYKINHKIASYLSELYAGSKFGVIISSHGNKKKFLEDQNEVKYEFIYEISNIAYRFIKEDINLEELRRFEETIPEKSLWRFIAMDRHWGRPFCKGASKYFDRREIVEGAATHQDILKVAYGYIRYFEQILTDFEIDVVLFFPGFHSMLAPILEQCCKNMNILHIALVGAKVKNYYSLSPNKHCTFPQIENTYKKIIKNDLDVDLSPGEQCYQEFLASADKGSGYSYHKKMVDEIHTDLFRRQKEYIGYFISLSKILIRSSMSLYKHQQGKVTINHDPNAHNLKYFLMRTLDDLIKHYQSKRLLSDNFYDKFDPGIKYLYYPLVAQPEYATQVIDNMWINQSTIIEALAKSIPYDWNIYVKEHPGTIGWRVRPFAFYKEIREYPNVRLIPIQLKNLEVVKNAQMVVTGSSTAGWEAILFENKPVINFNTALYNVTGLSRHCSDLTKLANTIHDEYKRRNEISAEERKRKIVALLNAIIMHSVSVDDPLDTFRGTIEGKSGKQTFENNARKISVAIKKYIDEH